MLILSVVGCASQIISPPEHNYALALHGTYVSGMRGVGGHEIDTLINGIVDPDAWDEGEGWEATFIRQAALSRPLQFMSRVRCATRPDNCAIERKPPYTKL